MENDPDNYIGLRLMSLRGN